MNTWHTIAPDSDFSIHNLPYGAYTTSDGQHGLGIAIGDHIIDLARWQGEGHLDDLGLPDGIFDHEVLNPFIRLGRPVWSGLRARLQALLTSTDDNLAQQLRAGLIAQADVTMRMPIHVGDYTDFYSSIEHATNVGKMFRDPENALLPNWRHLPVGYHGRASSIYISGTPIYRPNGQTKAPDAPAPTYGPSKRLDFELEMAFIIGGDTQQGEAITTDQAEDYIFGMVLFNDWSARDIQKWEYVPLGPFLGKNFASTVSPWIVTMEALAPFNVDGPEQTPEVLPYLKQSRSWNFDIDLEVHLTEDDGQTTVISRSNYRYMYWSMAQQLTHHTVNGCNVRVGDMMASGTISGHTPDSYGSMLELSWAGKNPLTLSSGATRTFVQDGDTITLKGSSTRDGKRIGFGSCVGEVKATR